MLDHDENEPTTTEHEEADAPLASFFDKGLITEVLRPVKSGKEATVWCCRGGPAAGAALVAAKIYRPIERRDFRNASVYREGQVILDKRLSRAVQGHTRAGRAFEFSAWIYAEWETLCRLYNAGADVPRPIARADRALLMQFIGDEDGPAPALNRVSLSVAEAGAVLQSLLRNIELSLACERIHADLSPFNILYWEGRAVIIDFPQATDPRSNPNARTLLQRDIANVCRYLSRAGVSADAGRLTDTLWRRFERGDL